MKKLIYIFSATFILFTACSKEYTPNHLTKTSTGIVASSLEVALLSDVVRFSTEVEGATTAKISLTDESGLPLKVLREAAPVSNGELSVEFTPEELGLHKIKEVAYLKIDANGYTAPLSVISVVSSWKAPKRNANFTTLEGSVLSDTITFAVSVNNWIDTEDIIWETTYTINSSTTSNITTAFSVEDLQGSKRHIFKVADLGNVGDTVNIAIKATYKGRSETTKTDFVIAPDKCSKTSAYEFTVNNILSTTDTAGGVSANDSTQTFFGLLTGKEYDLEEVLEAHKTEPILVLSNGGSLITGFFVDSCTVEYIASDKNTYKDNRRVATDSLETTWNGAPSSISISDDYYKVRIITGKSKPKEEWNYYYGHLKVETTAMGAFGKTAYTLNYAPKRNYEEE